MNKGKPIKCVFDIRNVPPSAYVMPDDGRKAKHMSRLRRDLVWFLASYANPDGTSIRPSRGSMAAALGIHLRTVSRLLVDLKTLGFLSDAGWFAIGETHLRNRTLNVAKIQQAAGTSTVPDTQPAQASTVPDTSSTVPDTQGHCATLDHPVCQIASSTVPDSYSTQPPFLNRPSEPPKQPPTVPTPPKGVVQADVCGYSFETHLAKEAAYPDTWDTVQQFTHLDMLTSQWKRDEKPLAAKLIAEHGWETFVAVEKLYWQEQDPQSFGRTLYKWSGMLEAFTGLLRKLPEGWRRQQAWQRWRETKEGAAEFDRQQAAAIRQQNEDVARQVEEARRAREARLTPAQKEAIEVEARRDRVRNDEMKRYWKGEEVIVEKACWYTEEVEAYFTLTVKHPATREDWEFNVDEATGKLGGKRLDT